MPKRAVLDRVEKTGSSKNLTDSNNDPDRLYYRRYFDARAKITHRQHSSWHQQDVSTNTEQTDGSSRDTNGSAYINSSADVNGSAYISDSSEGSSSASTQPLGDKRDSPNLLTRAFFSALLVAAIAAPLTRNFDFIPLFAFAYVLLFVLTVGLVESRIDRIGKAPRARTPSVLWRGISGTTVMLTGVVLPLIPALTLLFAMNAQGLLFLLIAAGNLWAWLEIRGGQTSFPGVRRFTQLSSIMSQVTLLVVILSSIEKLEAQAFTAPGLMCASLALSIHLKRKLSLHSVKSHSNHLFAIATTIFATAFLMPQLLVPFLTLPLNILVGGPAPLRGAAFSLLSSPVAIDALRAQLDNRSPYGAGLPRSLCRKCLYILTGDTRSKVGDYYAAPVVGIHDTSLTIENSRIAVQLLEKDQTAELDWTFTMSNSSGGEGREGKVDMLLPPGAALSDVQIIDPNASGKTKAKFGDKATLQREYSEAALAGRDPVLATLVTPRRVLVQCAPLLSGKPITVNLKIESAFALDKRTKSAQIDLPFVVSTNAATSNATTISVNGSCASSGTRVVTEDRRLSIPLRSEAARALSAREHPSKSLAQKPESTRGLIVALDASVQNVSVKQAMRKFCSAQHPEIRLYLIADPSRGIMVYTPSTIGAELSKTPFVGGDDNWELLSKAIEEAKSMQSDVLWIHGNKPWQEIDARDYSNTTWLTKVGYAAHCPFDFSVQCVNKVRVFDLQTVEGGNQILEQMQASVSDSTPFEYVQHTNSLDHDIFGVMQEIKSRGGGAVPPNKRYGYATSMKTSPTAQAKPSTDKIAQQEELLQLSLQGRKQESRAFALSNNLLSPYTAILARSASQVETKAQQTQQRSVAEVTAPLIGMPDNVFIGVNTAGTVRVSNLANLEAFLNILVNTFEITMLPWGMVSFIRGICSIRTRQGRVRLLAGLALATSALALPGCINWLVASTRDGSTFS